MKFLHEVRELTPNPSRITLRSLMTSPNSKTSHLASVRVEITEISPIRVILEKGSFLIIPPQLI